MSSPATCRHPQCRRISLRVLEGKPYCAVHAPPPPRSVAAVASPAGKPVCVYAGCTFLAVELVSGRYSCRTHVTHYARIARAAVETESLNADQQRDYQRLAVQAKKIAAAKARAAEAHEATVAIGKAHLERLSSAAPVSKGVRARIDRLARKMDREVGVILRDDAAKRGVELPPKSVLVNRRSSRFVPRSERDDWREAYSDAGVVEPFALTEEEREVLQAQEEAAFDKREEEAKAYLARVAQERAAAGVG